MNIDPYTIKPGTSVDLGNRTKEQIQQIKNKLRRRGLTLVDNVVVVENEK